MYDFILQVSMVISLAAMIYLLARAIPRVNDEEELAIDHNYFDHWLTSVLIAKIDAWFNLLMAKFLRRLRVIVLKFDNLLNRYINSVKHANNKHSANKSKLMEDLSSKED